MKIKNLIIYLILFLSYLAQCYYIDYSFVKGKQDRNCVKNQLETVSLANLSFSSQINFQNQAFVLSASKNLNSVNYIWTSKRINAKNGFVVQFDFEVSENSCYNIVTKGQARCILSIFSSCLFSKNFVYEKEICGAEGFAFVLQNTHPSASGTVSSGLGYESLFDTVAFEFDFQNSPEKNDPSTTPERHLSFIVKRGRADANERNALVHNYDPIEFFGKKVKCKIEYLNGNIRLFLNGVIQLGYYMGLDLERQLGSGLFYFGFTTASGGGGSTISIDGWKIWKTEPDFEKTKIRIKKRREEEEVSQTKEEDKKENEEDEEEEDELEEEGEEDVEEVQEKRKNEEVRRRKDRIEKKGKNGGEQWGRRKEEERRMKDEKRKKKEVRRRMNNERRSVKIGEIFDMEVDFYLACGDRFYFNLDSPENLTLSDHNEADCQILNRFFYSNKQVSSSAKLTLSCLKPGSKKISLLFEGKKTGMMKIKVNGGEIQNVRLDFFKGTTSTIDYAFQFYLSLLDCWNNTVLMGDSQVVTDFIQIDRSIYFDIHLEKISYQRNQTNFNQSYENTSNLNEISGIQLSSNELTNAYRISLTTQKIGNFSILNKFSNEVFGFQVLAGYLNPQKTFAKFVNEGKVYLAGGEGIINVFLHDSVSNEINAQSIDPKSFEFWLWRREVVGGNDSLLINMRIVEESSIRFGVRLEKAGECYVTVTYLNQMVQCRGCQFTVIPGEIDLKSTQIAQFDPISNLYISKDFFMMKKGDNMMLTLSFCDKYGNVLSISVIPQFLLVLSGNQMSPLNLVLEKKTETFYKILIENHSEKYFRNLVEKPNYQLSLINQGLIKSWNVTIYSNGEDQGFGNGELDVKASDVVFVDKLKEDRFIVAGTDQRIQIILKTLEKEVYNGWMPQEQLKYEIIPFFEGEKMENIMKTDIKGSYTATFRILKGRLNQRKVLIYVNGTKIEKELVFVDYPATGEKGRIEESVIKGWINQKLHVNLFVFDNYGNPNYHNLKGESVIQARHVEKAFLLDFECKSRDLGHYSCSISFEETGNYTLQSNLFEESHIVNVERKLSEYNSWSEILNENEIYINSPIFFRIVPKDEKGGFFIFEEMQKIVYLFSLAIINADGKLLEIPFILNSNGFLETEIKFESEGTYTFLPSFNSTILKCKNCLIEVLSPEKNRFELFQVENGNEKIFSSSSQLELDNLNANPIFLIKYFNYNKNKAISFPEDLKIFPTLNCSNSIKPTYVFEHSLLTPTILKLNLSDDELYSYHSELKNENCLLSIEIPNFISKISSTLTSTSSQPFTQRISVFLKGNGSFDENLTPNPPDPQKVVLLSEDNELKAGETGSINLELRSSNQKLFNDYKNAGWYRLYSAKTFQAKIGEDELLLEWVRGKRKGTYLLKFISLKAYEKEMNLRVFYLDPMDMRNFIEVGQVLKVRIRPGNVKYIVLNEKSLGKTYVAGEIIKLNMKPYDLYFNLVPNPAYQDLQISIKSNNVSENLNKIEISQNFDSEIEFSFNCEKTGLVEIRSPLFLNEIKKPVDLYSFKVLPGKPDLSSSIALLKADLVRAGERIIWKLLLRDSFENPINCSIENNITATFILENTLKTIEVEQPVSIGESYCFWEIQLNQVGSYHLKAFLNNNLVPSTKNRVKIVANELDPIKTSLSILKSAENVFKNYENGFFSHEKSDPLVFKPIIFDTYDNPIDLSLVPHEQLSLYLTNSQLASNGILFDFEPKTNLFTIPANFSKKYDDLISPYGYQLILHINSSSTFFNLILNSTIIEDGSNEELDPSKTFLQPLLIECQTGENAYFYLTLMTPSGVRKNEFLFSPDTRILLTFSPEDNNGISYSLIEWKKKGMYRVILKSNAFIRQIITITVWVDGVQVDSKLTLKIINLPVFRFENIENKTEGVVGKSFAVMFLAYEKLNNSLNLGLDRISINSAVVGPDGGSVQHGKRISVGVEITFEPKTEGIYLIKFDQNNKFPIIITSPLDLTKISTSLSSSSLVAGESFTLTLIIPSLSLPIIKYYILKDGDNTIIEGKQNITKEIEGKFIIKDNLNKTGIYYIKLEVNGVGLANKMRIEVFSGNANFLNSQVYYLDDFTNDYKLFTKDQILVEQNNLYEAAFAIVAIDSFGNSLLTCPFQFTEVKMGIYGDSRTENDMIRFSYTKIINGMIYFEIMPDDKAKYKDAPKILGYYSLKLQMKDQILLYKVDLTGTTQKTLQSLPLELSNTVFSKEKLVFIAGEADFFGLEFRSTGNLIDSEVKESSFSFHLEDEILKLRDFSFQTSKGDQPGRFLVRVSSKIANEKREEAKLWVHFNGERIIKPLLIRILAGVVERAEIQNKNPLEERIGEEIKLNLALYDKFGNSALSFERKFDLKVANEEEYQVMEITKNINIITRMMEVKLMARRSGKFSIQSSYLSRIRSFKVKLGEISHLYSKVSISSNSLQIGEILIVEVLPFDENNRPIDCQVMEKKCLNAVSFVYISNDIISQKVFLEKLPLKYYINSSKSGLLKVKVFINKQEVKCNRCSNIIIKAGAIQLNRTQISSETAKIIGNRRLEINLNKNKGNKLILYAYFFDELNNPIQKFEIEDSFSALLFGNNAEITKLIVDKLVNGKIKISSPKNLIKNLAPASNYTIKLLYGNILTNKSYSADFYLDIKGIEDDRGNGPCLLNNTHISNKNVHLTAGIESSIILEIRTANDKRCTKPLDISLLSSNNNLKSVNNETAVTVNFEPTNKQNRFLIKFLGFKILNQLKEHNKIDFFYNNISLSASVNILIDPSVPDASKTIEVVSMPSRVRVGQIVNLMVKLFDRFGNQFLKPKFADNIEGESIVGDASFLKTKYDELNTHYIVSFEVFNLPSALEINVFFVVNRVKYPIFLTSYKSLATHDNNWKNIEVKGSCKTGRIGENLKWFVFIKDSSGFCFEKTQIVTLVLNGTFENDLIFKIAGVARGAGEGEQFIMNGFKCLKHYEAELEQAQLKKIGNYRLEVFIENQTAPNLVVDNIIVRAGSIVPSNTLVSMVNLINYSDKKLDIPFNTQVSFKLEFRDFFSNFVNDLTLIKVDFFISNYQKDKDFQILFENASSYQLIHLTIFRLGKLPPIQLSINNEVIDLSLLHKINFPLDFEVVSGPCSPLLTQINSNLLNNSLIQYVNDLYIRCRDKDGNEMGVGGENFTASLHFLNSSLFYTYQLNDLSNGTYKLSFSVDNPGEYKLIIQLNSIAFGPAFYFWVRASQCEDSKPYFCISTNQCVPSYYECSFPFLNKSLCQATTPFFCYVSGIPQCVAHLFSCDCPPSYKKCPTLNICLPSSFFCPSSSIISCPFSFPHKCFDSSCRSSPSQCPSPLVCPPGYLLSPSLTCLPTFIFPTTSFSNESQSTFPTQPLAFVCPTNFPHRCSDQTCVLSINDCPTSLSCGEKGKVICPDQSCVFSELECKPPKHCPVGLKLCPDTTCISPQNQCRRSTTCPFGLALCPDGSCKSTCPSLQRSLQAISSCTLHICQTGECVTSSTYCPPLFSCPPSLVLCPDGSCSSSASLCPPPPSCPSSSFLCWDNTCASAPSLCPTRISCPSKYPILCNDGSCQPSSSNCSQPSSSYSSICPPSAPFRCGNNACRRRREDCPSNIVCPISHPFKCSDSSCVKDPSSCLFAVEASICNKFRCPDGSCVTSSSLCPASMVCPASQIRCWDSQCVDHLSSCPSLPSSSSSSCPSSSLLCPSGKCSSSFSSCPSSFLCPSSLPIICSDGLCAASASFCSPVLCPPGFRKCSDSSCVSTTIPCPSSLVTCPKDYSFRCQDNTCRASPIECPSFLSPSSFLSFSAICFDGSFVSDKSECPEREPCPFDRPIRCEDGECIEDHKECSRKPVCPSGRFQCYDGRCVGHISQCPTPNCPKGTPYQCPSGLCVPDLLICNKENGCPIDRPVKCSDGSCRSSHSLCPLTPSCPISLSLCPDGSCQPSDQCPLQNSCSAKTPKLCSNGKCLPVDHPCPPFLCPSLTPFKCSDGLCTSSPLACMLNHYSIELESSQVSNGDGIRFFFCADGKKVKNLENCAPAFKCPSPLIRCPDGSCKIASKKCPLTTEGCPKERPFRCENGECIEEGVGCRKEDGCRGETVKCSKYGLCSKNEEECQQIADRTFLTNGCTLSKPIKCNENQCATSITDCISNKKDQNASFNPQFFFNYHRCPIDKPFLCANLDCVGDWRLCIISKECPKDQNFLCSNLTCTNDQRKCDDKLCPPTRPIRCKEGTCVGLVEECALEINEEYLELDESFEFTISPFLEQEVRFAKDPINYLNLINLISPKLSIEGKNTFESALIKIEKLNINLPDKRVSSPILNLTTVWKSFGLLLVSFMNANNDKLNNKNYTLYRFVEGRWNKLEDSASHTNSFDFIIKKDGVYGLFKNEAKNSQCDWWCQNKGVALGILGGLLFIGLLVAAFIYCMKVVFIEKFIEVNLDIKILKTEDNEKNLKESLIKLREKEKIMKMSEEEKNHAKDQNEILMKEVTSLEKEKAEIRKKLIEQNS